MSSMETQEISYKSKVLELVSKTKSFCPMLWNHITISPNTAIKHFCCIAGGGDDEPSFEKYWNGERINQARVDMLHSKRPKECNVCWTREDAGIKSHRTNNISMFNSDYDKLKSDHWKKLYENIVSTLADKKMPHQPQYYDVKFGNLCNLKCRMCNPESSSQINKEAISNTHLYESNLYPHKSIDDSLFLWFKNKDNSFWQDFNSFSKDVYKFKFTGGEPLLIDEVIHFLQKLIKEDKAKNIMLHLITNATKIDEKLLVGTLLKFKTLKINVSVDGAYNHYEYIRYPGRWQTLDNNMKLLRKHDVLANGFNTVNDYSKIQLSISPVLQMYNLFNIIDIYKYAESIGSVILDVNFVESPKHMAPRNMTNEMKNIVIEYYSKSISEIQYPEHKTHINYFIEYLSNTEANDDSAIEKFVTYTNTYDKLRNQNFKNSCPKEYELFREYFE